MKTLLEAIRGVAGVWGVLLWNKVTDEFERILPARMTDEDTQQLCAYLSEYCRRNTVIPESIVKLTQGWAIIHDQPDFALLMLAKSDLNRATLKLVMKSTLVSIQSSLSSYQATGGVGAARFKLKHIGVLVRAINLSISFFQGKLSKFEIASRLRQIKESLLPEYPVLKLVTVDANGGIIPIRGAERGIDSSLVAAAAQMIKAFLQQADLDNGTAGFDLEKLTGELRPQLSELGFYNYFPKQGVEQ